MILQLVLFLGMLAYADSEEIAFEAMYLWERHGRVILLYIIFLFIDYEM